MNLSLSTCWCSARHTDGYDMLVEIRELGFEQAELSHGIRASLVPGIIKAVDEGIVSISSLHNFCPLPSAVQHAAPNLFQPSTKKRAERTSWEHYTRQTVEFAAQLGASCVIMHSGSVEFRFRSPEAILETLVEEGHLVEKTEALLRLGKKSERAIKRVIDAYSTVFEFATEKGVTFCVENREGVLELPLDSEFTEFFETIGDQAPAAYWHDTGHAQIKEKLGLLEHESHLEKMANNLIGWHLHDVSAEGKDHQVPGTGTVDFSMIRRFIKPEHTLVVELSPRLTKDEVLQSKEYLEAQLG